MMPVGPGSIKADRAVATPGGETKNNQAKMTPTQWSRFYHYRAFDQKGC